MQPDEPNQEERAEQLPQDGQTPFQPADPNPGTTGSSDPVTQNAGQDELPSDHPATDTGIDGAELYDEGVGGAAEGRRAAAAEEGQHENQHGREHCRENR